MWHSNLGQFILKLLGIGLGLLLIGVAIFITSLSANKPIERECIVSAKIYKEGDAISLQNPNGNSTEEICLQWSK